MTVDEVREELGRLGLSQSALAREAGVSRQEVSRWLREQRVPTPLNLNRMEAALERLEYYVEETFDEADTARFREAHRG